MDIEMTGPMSEERTLVMYRDRSVMFQAFDLESSPETLRSPSSSNDGPEFFVIQSLLTTTH